MLKILLVLLCFSLCGCAGGHLDSDGSFKIPFGASEPKEQSAKFMGLVYYGEPKEDVLANLGYPQEVYNQGDFNVWLYHTIYRKDLDPLENIEIYFLNGYVKDCKQIIQ